MSFFFDCHDLRAAAKSYLPRFVFDFIEGGAQEELLIDKNREIFKKVQLVPSVLRGAECLDTSINMFGSIYPLPLAVAPTGLNGIIFPKGDQIISRAAAQTQIPFIMSTAANCSIKDILSASGIPPWFQLYVVDEKSVNDSIEQAELIRCPVLVITVDMPVSGNRLRDLRNGFHYPLKPSWKLFLDCLSRPSWSLSQIIHGESLNFRLHSNQFSKHNLNVFNKKFDRSFSWVDLKKIRKRWTGQLLIKGILHPDDAIRACEEGADGVIISNHGGRQCDMGPTSLQMLPLIKKAVKNKIPVMFDGGIRSGNDVIKALALGADSVLIGRVCLYGLAAGQEKGVIRAFEILKEEIINGMTLLGCSTVKEVKELLRINESDF